MKTSSRYESYSQFLAGPPVPGRFNQFDPPDDFFRIRLVATMLETCGLFFNRGAAGKKLDYFLSFFQVGTIEPSSKPDMLTCREVLCSH